MHWGAETASFKFFSFAVIEYPDSSDLGKTGFVLAYGSRGRESIVERRYGYRQRKHGSWNRKLVGHMFIHIQEAG